MVTQGFLLKGGLPEAGSRGLTLHSSQTAPWEPCSRLMLLQYTWQEIFCSKVGEGLLNLKLFLLREKVYYHTWKLAV